MKPQPLLRITHLGGRNAGCDCTLSRAIPAAIFRGMYTFSWLLERVFPRGEAKLTLQGTEFGCYEAKQSGRQTGLIHGAHFAGKFFCTSTTEMTASCPRTHHFSCTAPVHFHAVEQEKFSMDCPSYKLQRDGRNHLGFLPQESKCFRSGSGCINLIRMESQHTS